MRVKIRLMLSSISNTNYRVDEIILLLNIRKNTAYCVNAIGEFRPLTIVTKVQQLKGRTHLSGYDGILSTLVKKKVEDLFL